MNYRRRVQLSLSDEYFVNDMDRNRVMIIFVPEFLDANSLAIKYLHIKRKKIIYIVNKTF